VAKSKSTRRRNGSAKKPERPRKAERKDRRAERPSGKTGSWESALREHREAQLRKELDPDEPVAILRRIGALSNKIGSVPATPFEAGGELLARIALDLRMLLPPFAKPNAARVTALQKRLEDAMLAFDPAEQLLVVVHAVRDAAELEDHAAALSFAKQRIARHLPDVQDALLTAAIAANRQRLVVGRPRKDEPKRPKAADGLTAIVKLMGRFGSAESLRRQIRKAESGAAERARSFSEKK
jgi:hypothetical protein